MKDSFVTAVALVLTIACDFADASPIELSTKVSAKVDNAQRSNCQCGSACECTPAKNCGCLIHTAAGRVSDGDSGLLPAATYYVDCPGGNCKSALGRTKQAVAHPATAAMPVRAIGQAERRVSVRGGVLRLFRR